ncbi:hypothetical protein COOONC_15509 [Cooperia oncophora]
MSKFSRSVPDGLKMADDEIGPKSPKSPNPGGVAWFVDELAVIEEEAPEKRRTFDEDSMRSSRSGSSSRTEQRTREHSLVMPAVPEKEEKSELKLEDREKTT